MRVKLIIKKKRISGSRTDLSKTLLRVEKDIQYSIVLEKRWRKFKRRKECPEISNGIEGVWIRLKLKYHRVQGKRNI